MLRVLNFGGTKFNFIDDNDNFVGFDTADDCCANGGWFISDRIHTEVPSEYANGLGIKIYPEYHFDDSFFEEVSLPLSNGGMVIFKLTAFKTVPDLFLHLFNVHNGYYAKGFKSVLGDKIHIGSI